MTPAPTPSPVDGGAAFPSVCRDDPGHPASLPGMSLRDWLAGQALVGVLASDKFVTAIGNASVQVGDESSYPAFAEAAYELADAMIEARGK